MGKLARREAQYFGLFERMFSAVRRMVALFSTVVMIALSSASIVFAGGAILASSNDAKPSTISPEAREAANSIFAERCAVCHGDDGGGAGPGAANLNPKPQNFRSRKWQKSMTDQQIAMIIVNGGSSVGLSASMAANPDLEGQPDVVAALVERVRKFGK
jgi:mono/diheme cytochrome c family protein